MKHGIGSYFNHVKTGTDYVISREPALTVPRIFTYDWREKGFRTRVAVNAAAAAETKASDEPEPAPEDPAAAKADADAQAKKMRILQAAREKREAKRLAKK